MNERSYYIIASILCMYFSLETVDSLDATLNLEIVIVDNALHEIAFFAALIFVDLDCSCTVLGVNRFDLRGVIFLWSVVIVAVLHTCWISCVQTHVLLLQVSLRWTQCLLNLSIVFLSFFVGESLLDFLASIGFEIVFRKVDAVFIIIVIVEEVARFE